LKSPRNLPCSRFPQFPGINASSANKFHAERLPMDWASVAQSADSNDKTLKLWDLRGL
jgi:hypothetical protein